MGRRSTAQAVPLPAVDQAAAARRMPTAMPLRAQAQASGGSSGNTGSGSGGSSGNGSASADKKPIKEEDMKPFKAIKPIPICGFWRAASTLGM